MSKKILSKVFKNIQYAVLANIVSILITGIITLIVPKLFSSRQYGYWQLYIFFTSYVGFFHFGLQDGMYLRYGGCKYEKLDKKLMHSQLCILTLLEVIFSIIISVYAIVFVYSLNKRIVLLAFSVVLILYLPNTHLQYVLQMTNRIKEYTYVIIIEKITYGILTGLFLMCGVKSFISMIFLDIFAKVIALLYACITCRDIVVNRMPSVKVSLKEAWINTSVGIKLLAANLASMLVVGVVRFLIEKTQGIVAFAQISLAFSLCSFILIFVTAVGQVLFPMLKRVASEKLADIYKIVDYGLLFSLFGILIFYQPIYILLSAWLPQYESSLKYFAFLLPMCVFEGKTALLLNTYFKALRKEKQLFFINAICVVFSVVLAIVNIYIFKNLDAAVLGVSCVVGLRCILLEFNITKELHLSHLKSIIIELLFSFLFVFLTLVVDGIFSAFIYTSIFALFWLGVERKNMINYVNILKHR